MADVHVLPAREGSSLVSILTELLQKAKAGDVRSIAAVVVLDSGLDYVVTPTDDGLAVIGGLFLMSRTIAESIVP